MKGCLSFIIKTVIAVLVFFGLLHLGVIDFIKEQIEEYKTVPQEQIIEEAQDIIDLSQIDDEYTVDKNLKILQNRMIVAEHNATGQKMIIIEPKDGNILTKEDIEAEDIQQKIENTMKKYKYQLIKFDKLEVEKKGEISAMGGTIPYIKVNAEVKHLPMKDIEGIVGVAEQESGKNLIIISVNEKGKYSQIITDAFYKQVK